MNKEFLIIILKRFAKAFVFGGISVTLVTLASHPLTDLHNLKAWVGILVTAFLTGGLMGLEKLSQGYEPR